MTASSHTAVMGRVDERHMEIHVFLMQNASLPTFPLLSHIKLAKQDEPEPGVLFDSTGKIGERFPSLTCSQQERARQLFSALMWSFSLGSIIYN